MSGAVRSSGADCQHPLGDRIRCHVLNLAARRPWPGLRALRCAQGQDTVVEDLASRHCTSVTPVGVTSDPSTASKRRHALNPLTERARLVTDLFEDLFQRPGKPFGSASIGWMGVHDGVEGVQWNAWYSRPEQTAWMGVNLEGMLYDGWPVARLIERELLLPLLLTHFRPQVTRPAKVRVSWRRDAWQGPIRVKIMEAELRPTPIPLDKLCAEGWAHALNEAKHCLNPRRNHRGRRRTQVTLSPSGAPAMKYVTPHLQFMTPFDCRAPKATRAMQRVKANLDPLHDFARRQAERG